MNIRTFGQRGTMLYLAVLRENVAYSSMYRSVSSELAALYVFCLIDDEGRCCEDKDRPCFRSSLGFQDFDQTAARARKVGQSFTCSSQPSPSISSTQTLVHRTGNATLLVPGVCALQIYLTL